MVDPHLGNIYQDDATKFRGVCVGVWIGYSTTQFALAYVAADGTPKNVWIESDRLRLIPKETKTGFGAQGE